MKDESRIKRARIMNKAQLLNKIKELYNKEELLTI